MRDDHTFYCNIYKELVAHTLAWVINLFVFTNRDDRNQLGLVWLLARAGVDSLFFLRIPEKQADRFLSHRIIGQKNGGDN